MACRVEVVDCCRFRRRDENADFRFIGDVHCFGCGSEIFIFCIF